MIDDRPKAAYKSSMTKTTEVQLSIAQTGILLNPAAEKRQPFFQDGPSPLLGRLLVKIDKKEVAYKYRSAILGDSGARKRFPTLIQLPRALRISNAVELGETGKGKIIIRIDLEDTISLNKVLSLLRRSRFSINEEFRQETRAGKVSSIVLEMPPDLTSDLLSPAPSFQFSQLNSTSPLQGVFRQLGVRSLQRVFPMVQRQNTRGVVTVSRMADLLKDAKKRFRVRTARRVRNVAIPPDMENWFIIYVSSKTDLRNALSILRKTPGVQEASFDYAVDPHQDPRQEPSYQAQWELHANPGINVEPAWDTTAAGQRVVVAVLDSGIKEDLDEFAGRQWHNSSEVAGDGIDNDANGYVDDITGITVNCDDPVCPPTVNGGHGTAIAAIIAANATNSTAMAGVAGIADVGLMNISFGRGVGCRGPAEGFQYATLNGADVINASWGTWPNPLLWEATQAALASGVTIIASVGNHNKRIGQSYEIEYASYPACWDHVIAVGGTDAQGHRWIESDRNIGSNYGIRIDVVAPAKNVTAIGFSSANQTTADLIKVTGTSASAALVSGIAVLVLAKYPHMKVDKMRSWLRVTATDLADPAATEAFFGAGLVNAGNALTQGEPDPIILEVKLEKAGFSEFSNAVGGSPELHMKLEGPVDRSMLEIGEGDAPDTWVEPNIVSDAGHQLLDTGGLKNRQVYTIRLKAWDAVNRIYTAYDWFMPIRAMITSPADQSAIVPRWGMPYIFGIVDVRPGASYRLCFFDWLDPIQSYYMPWAVPSWLTGPTAMSGISACMLAAPETVGYTHGVPKSGALERAFRTEGWKELRLYVKSPAGAVTVDRRNVFIDATHFRMHSGWPVDIVSLQYPFLWTGLARGIKVVDIDGNNNRRIFVQDNGHFACLNVTGAILWDLPIYLDRDYGHEDASCAPVFLVDDLDGDGVLEIVVAGKDFSNHTIRLHLLKPDGSPFGPQWPKSICSFEDADSGTPQLALHEGPGKIHAGDVDGDGVKEIIFFEKGRWATAHNEAENGNIHVLKLDGAEVPGWPVTVPEVVCCLQVGDIDADGKHEILAQLCDRYVVYGGDGQIRPGWPVPTFQGVHKGARLVQLDYDPQLEILHYGLADTGTQLVYAVNVLKHDGSNLPGFPVYLDPGISRVPAAPQRSDFYSLIYAKPATIIPGGRPQIVVAYDKIKVLSADGLPVAGHPDIDLGGQARGVDLIDVDGDGAVEYVVVVEKWANNMGLIQVSGFTLEAYKLDGTSLSVTDKRWPIRLTYAESQSDCNHALGATVTIEDMYGNGTLQAINLIRSADKGHNRLEVLDLR